MSSSESDKDYKNHLRAALLDSSNRFDSAVLSLSSGLLALSLAFLRDLVNPRPPTCVLCLVCSWIMLGTAVITTVVSFLTSQSCLRSRLEGNETKAKSWIKRTELLNRASAALFVSGVCLTIIFVAVNLNMGSAVMANDRDRDNGTLDGGYVPEKKPAESDQERGYVPPPPPVDPPEKPTTSESNETED